jgi:hypothetical protein
MATDYSDLSVEEAVRAARASSRHRQVLDAAVAVMGNCAAEAFDGQGNYSNQADILFHKIGALVVPNNNTPPMPPGR